MSEAQKQVSVEKYDRNYYETLYISPDYSTNFDWNTFGDIYKEIANVLPLSKESTVVDFGCGNGELAFCLYKKYGCHVIGIDYSADAVSIADGHLARLKAVDPAADITFINNNNDALPELRNIDVVYFCDVVEHMYDDEIALILEKIKTWNKDGRLKIVVHTDNDWFLKGVRPFLDLLSVLMGVATREDIHKRNVWEDERHVNLTTPGKFRVMAAKFGFSQTRLKYPEISLGRVRRQLGRMASIPGLTSVIFLCVKMLQFLSPSFYAVYEYRQEK